MTRIRHFDQDCIDHRHVRGYRHAIVEEAGVLQASFLVVDVFLVQRPTDTLHRAALQLTFDIGRMNGGTDVLNRRIAQDFHKARFRIDFDVADMRAEARPRALCVDVGLAADRAAGLAGHARDVSDRERLVLIGLNGNRDAVLPFDLIGIDFPDLGGALLELLDDILCGFNHGLAGREGHAAAAGQIAIGHRLGVGDQGLNFVDVDAQHFRRHDRHRSA